MSRPRGDANVPVTERAELLAEALEVGGDRLDPAAVARAREVLQRVGERWALKGGRTVVALAGATGSGKSSLFNALIGEPVATIGARRPTTDVPTAAVWGAEPADELLDWLGVRSRHHVDGTDAMALRADLDGLVLVDLPDFDSRELSHRVEADRILERADVFVWVADPQKYADARLHEDYLAPLREHSTVMLVVLNQSDRLPDEDAVRRVQDDLARLVREDGAGEFDVLATSARLGTGLDELTSTIGKVVSARAAAEQRLSGDLRALARELLRGVGEREPGVGDSSDDLVAALKQAAGIPVVLDAVRRDYQRRAIQRAGWPVTRWLSRFRPDPLARLRLGDDRPGAVGIAPSDVRTVLGRSSLPPPSPAARSAVQLATRQVGESAAEGLPAPWAEAVAQAAAPEESHLADALDQAVMATPLRARDPWWWSVVGILQLVFVLAAVAGLLWLATIAVMGWLQAPIETPLWGPVPVPVALLVGGLLVGVVLGALVRVLARTGAQRRRRLIEGRLHAAVAEVAEKHVGAPVREVLDQHRRTRELLLSAAR